MGLFGFGKKKEPERRAPERRVAQAAEYDLAIFYNGDIQPDLESFVLNETFNTVCRENGLFPETERIEITIATRENLFAKGNFTNGEAYECSYTIAQKALIFHFECRSTPEETIMNICISLAKILRWLGGGFASINGLKNRTIWQAMLNKLSQEL